MPSPLRLEKLNNLLREEIAKILAREIEFPAETMVTVTRVLISPDGNYAAVYVSILGSRPKEALENLVKNVYNIQKRLNRSVKMRPVPKIRFEIDKEEFRREKVEKSLSKLKEKGEV